MQTTKVWKAQEKKKKKTGIELNTNFQAQSPTEAKIKLMSFIGLKQFR